MKKITLLLTLLSFKLFAGVCLHVGFQSGLTCSGKGITIDDLNIDFSTKMKVSDKALTVVDIPIYIYSNKKRKVKLLLNENQPLSNGQENINTKFFLIKRNKEREITLGKPIKLVGRRKRKKFNGHTIVAYLRIQVNALSDTQTAGKYQLKKSLQAIVRRTTSPTASLTATGEVEQVTMVGFENVSSYTTQQRFKDATINYGLIDFDTVNRQVRDIYVKNNTLGACQISFSTSPLISQIDPNYKIGMNYFYQQDGEERHQILNSEPFTLIRGKSNGSKVGSMTFETEQLKSSLIAGDYKAVIHVTVSAN